MILKLDTMNLRLFVIQWKTENVNAVKRNMMAALQMKISLIFCEISIYFMPSLVFIVWKIPDSHRASLYSFDINPHLSGGV